MVSWLHALLSDMPLSHDKTLFRDALNIYYSGLLSRGFIGYNIAEQRTKT